jgi:hypothetical protein
VGVFEDQLLTNINQLLLGQCPRVAVDVPTIKFQTDYETGYTATVIFENNARLKLKVHKK